MSYAAPSTRATRSPCTTIPIIVVPLDTVTAKFGLPGGKSVDAAMKTGEPVWSEATKHGPESTVKQSARVIIIELKGKAGAK